MLQFIFVTVCDKLMRKVVCFIVCNFTVILKSNRLHLFAQHTLKTNNHNKLIFADENENSIRKYV